MACKETGVVDRGPMARRWPKRLASVLGLMVVLAVAGAWAGQVTTGRASATAVATRPPPAIRAVMTPVTEPSVPSTTTSVPPEMHPTGATVPPATVPATVPVTTVSRPVATVAVPAPPDACAVALAYLAAHAAPGFAHFCRPGSLQTAMGASAAYTCLPGTGYSCPDGVAEIIIAEPTCPASYENEASNSYWNFSQAGAVKPGTVQNGRTWDPFGACP